MPRSTRLTVATCFLPVILAAAGCISESDVASPRVAAATPTNSAGPSSPPPPRPCTETQNDAFTGGCGWDPFRSNGTFWSCWFDLFLAPVPVADVQPLLPRGYAAQEWATGTGVTGLTVVTFECRSGGFVVAPGNMRNGTPIRGAKVLVDLAPGGQATPSPPVGYDRRTYLLEDFVDRDEGGIYARFLAAAGFNLIPAKISESGGPAPRDVKIFVNGTLWYDLQESLPSVKLPSTDGCMSGSAYAMSFARPSGRTLIEHQGFACHYGGGVGPAVLRAEAGVLSHVGGGKQGTIAGYADYEAPPLGLAQIVGVSSRLEQK